MNISEDYKEFVNKTISNCKETIGPDLHSIYLCGSIPKGTAKKNFSDADFTMVLNEEPDNIEEKVSGIKSSLLNRFNFIPKIDLLYVTVDKVLTNPYEWGFWITIISRCIYGDDLKCRLPEINPNRDLVLALNEDTSETFVNLTEKFIESGYKDLRLKKKLSRRVLIALYTFIYPYERVWIDDIYHIYKKVLLHYPQYDNLVTYFFNTYKDPSIDQKEFLKRLKKARYIISSKLEELSITNRMI